MSKPEFTQIDRDLWEWQDWLIAYANGQFWLLTCAGREFGPYQFFDEAYGRAADLRNGKP